MHQICINIFFFFLKIANKKKTEKLKYVHAKVSTRKEEEKNLIIIIILFILYSYRVYTNENQYSDFNIKFAFS